MYLQHIVCLLLIIKHTWPVNCIEYGPHSYITASKGISHQCELDIIRLNLNLENRTSWAVEMWEATAKEQSGLLRSNIYQLGKFDECVISKSNSGIERQYCLVKVILDDPMYNEEGDLNYDDANYIVHEKLDVMTWNKREISWGVCVPASCSRQDLEIVLKDYKYFNQLSSWFNVTHRIELNENSCKVDTSKAPLTFGSNAFICVFVSVCIVVILATIYHRHLETSCDSKEKKSDCPNVVKAFSIINNTRQLMAKDDECLKATYGLRVLSTLMIMFSHFSGRMSSQPISNRNALEEDMKIPTNTMFVLQTDLMVDTFFILGGFFAVYSLYRNFSNKKFLHVAIARYFRLLPLCAFLMFFIATLYRQLNSGPLWHLIERESDKCANMWWVNMLTLNNYVNVKEMCMLHSWYIPCDFHFYLVAYFLTYFLSNPKKEKIGLILTISLLILPMILQAAIIYIMELPAIFLYIKEESMSTQFYSNIYIPSHTRFTPYAMGLLTGYIYIKYRNRINLSNVMSTVLFLAAQLVYFSSTYIFAVSYEVNPPYEPISSALIGAFFRPIKALCVCVTIFTFTFGNVPFVSWLFGSTPVIVMGKLTYGAYLISLLFQMYDSSSAREPIYYNLNYMIQKSHWYNEISFIASYFGYVLIEAPCNNLCKMMLSSWKNDRKVKSNEEKPTEATEK